MLRSQAIQHRPRKADVSDEDDDERKMNFGKPSAANAIKRLPFIGKGDIPAQEKVAVKRRLQAMLKVVDDDGDAAPDAGVGGDDASKPQKKAFKRAAESDADDLRRVRKKPNP